MSELLKEYDVYSEKYDVKGKLFNLSGLVVKLEFDYGGRKIEMGLPTSHMLKDDFVEQAKMIMESFIERQRSAPKRKTMMHNWYIKRLEEATEPFICLQGNTSGHPRLVDSAWTYSSAVQSIYCDFDNGEVLVQTRNTLFHCPMAECTFDVQEKYAEFVPMFDKMRERYENGGIKPRIEPGKVLLVVANWCEYYYHSCFYVPEGKKKALKITGSAHIGSFQDSFLIESEDYSIDLRYFPHYENLEFYSEHTNSCPLFVENVGDIPLYLRFRCGVIKVGPGERKEVCKANAEANVGPLPGGDLYPAGFGDF